MMRTKANLRDTGLDVICGLLVLHMILGHIFSNFCGIEDSVFYYWEERLLFFFMPWFFFKNGMFFKPKTEQKTFIKRDFRRFMIPFIIWSAIGEIIRWIDVALSANATSIAWYAASIKSLIVKGMILGNAPLWFLLSLFIVRIIFNAAMRVRQLPLALTLASICFAYMCWKLDFNWMVSVSHALLGFFCFGCGYFLREKQRSIHVVALAGMSLFAITAISPTYIRMCSNTMAYGSCYFVGIVAAIASIVLINNILPPPTHTIWRIVPCRFLAFVGRESMSFYVTHWVILEIIQIVLVRILDVSDNWMKFWWMLVISAVALPLLALMLRRTRLV